MPDLAMHYYFGQAVRSALPADIPIEQEIFDFALSGPDDWFYCFSNQKLSSRAHIMHRVQTGEFLRALATSPSLFSYFAGFYCHHILDATCHPYIISCTGSYDHTRKTRQYLGNHTALERALDRWILKDHEESVDPAHPLTDVMFQSLLPEELEQPLNAVYEKVYGWEGVFSELQKAKKKMYRYLRILEDPHGVAKLITDIVPHPMLRSLPYSRHYYEKEDVLNLSHRQWHHPKDPHLVRTDSVPELIEQARRDAVRVIRDVYHGDLSGIQNRSYITGFDLEDPRNDAPETYLLLSRSVRSPGLYSGNPGSGDSKGS